MITHLHKNIKEMTIGILGLRNNTLEKILIDKEIPYTTLTSHNDINSSFDFVFCSGYYYMIPKDVLDKVLYGVYVFHETPLPEGKGHAPLQWTILNGRKNITITGFKCVPAPDSGEIIYQYNMPIEPYDTLVELENKRQIGTSLCFEKVIDELLSGVLVLRQQTGVGSYHKKRTPEDSELDINKSLKELWDNIRICDNDKFPAFFRIENKKIILNYKVV